MDSQDTEPHAGPEVVTSVDANPHTPAMRLTGNPAMQVTLVWRGRTVAYQLYRRGKRITIGPHKRATLITPAVTVKAARFTLLRPRRGGYQLRLAPGMRGEIVFAQPGQAGTTAVADLLAAPPPGRRRTALRDVRLHPGDRARVTLNEAGDLHVEARFVDPPEFLPKPRNPEPMLRKTAIICSFVLSMFAGLFTQIWGENPPRNLVITAERFTKLQAPMERQRKAEARRAEEKKRDEEADDKKKSGEEKKEKADEGQAKRAKEKSGRIGREDATARDTVIPKGDKDVLREKVSKVGLLGLIGKEKQGGSGLSRLFAESNDVEQAVAGMSGARVAVGHGARGLATSGGGAGGGGTGYGKIYGAGNLDTGGRGSKGTGRGPKLGDRGEREVKVSMSTGNGESDGSLSKDQIEKVVRAHAAGIKYCYEKELQRKPSLAGNIDMFWTIQPDGAVGKASVKASSMSDAAVEGCIIRQVKQWQFPKAAGQTIVGRYPFLFKGGH
jgi:hypothetical protein